MTRILSRWTVGLACAAAMLSAGVFAQGTAPAPAQGTAPAQAGPQLTEEEKREASVMLDLADTVASGTPAPNDFSVTWVGESVIKAPQQRQYVPFTITLDPSGVPDGRVIMLWQVLPKSAAAVPAAAPADPAAAPAPAAERKAVYQNLQTVTVSGQSPVRISRAFVVPAGSYDVQVIVKQPSPAAAAPAAAAPAAAPTSKVSLITQSVDVPDFWNNEFNTSSVVVAQGLEPLAAPPTPEQTVERPYLALGIGNFVNVGNTRFTKANELVWFFAIYNPRASSADKPDVLVEYMFYKKGADGAEAPHGKMPPRELNAAGLDPKFSLTAGHQLQAGEALPLSSFPEGDYRLEIKVTDRLSNTTVTRNVNFSVAA